METRNLDDIYGTPGLVWETVTARLDLGYTQAPDTGGPNRHSTWLTTINADGTPHVTGIGSIWLDGAFFFETGDRTRKARNIERDPRCAVALAVHEFDLIVDGVAEKVLDPATVARLAAIWAEDWPCEVDESGVALTAPYSAPSAGPPPWFVYNVTLRSATAIGTVELGGATRWVF